MLKNITKILTSILASFSLLFTCISPVFAEENTNVIKVESSDATFIECKSLNEAFTFIETSDQNTYKLILLNDLILEEEIVFSEKIIAFDGQNFKLSSSHPIIVEGNIEFTNIVLEAEVLDKEGKVLNDLVKNTIIETKEDKDIELNLDKELEDKKESDPEPTAEPDLENQNEGEKDKDLEESTDLDETKVPDSENQNEDEKDKDLEEPTDTVDPTDEKDLENPSEEKEPDPEEPDEEPETPIVEENNWQTMPMIASCEYGQIPVLTKGIAKFGNDSVSYTYSDKKDGQFANEMPTSAGHWFMKAFVTETETYKGLETIVEFDILPKKVTTVTVPDVTKDTDLKNMVIKDGNQVLKLGKDYRIVKEIKEDVAIVTITFEGNYSGEIVKTYKIEKKIVKQEETVKKKSVKTGAETNQAIWIGMFVGSILLIGVLFFMKKRS